MSINTKHLVLLMGLISLTAGTSSIYAAEKSGWNADKKRLLNRSCFTIVKETNRHKIEKRLGRSLRGNEVTRYNRLNSIFTRQCSCLTSAAANRFSMTEISNNPDAVQDFYEQLISPGGQCQIRQSDFTRATR